MIEALAFRRTREELATGVEAAQKRQGGDVRVLRKRNKCYRSQPLSLFLLLFFFLVGFLCFPLSVGSMQSFQKHSESTETPTRLWRLGSRRDLAIALLGTPARLPPRATRLSPCPFIQQDLQTSGPPNSYVAAGQSGLAT